MEMQQSILFSIVVEVQNMLYCLYFLGYFNRPVPFGLKKSVAWRFYIAVNSINVLGSWTVEFFH
jgi:hypothetical protein